MNRRMVLYTVGNLILVEAILLLLPVIVCLCYPGESDIWSFLITIGIAVVLGSAMKLISRPRTRVIYARDGFLIVAGTWVWLSLIGALPFVISGEIPNYIDAVFETVSGFTTTGASIVTDVSAMSHGTLFWRSFTHWVGGMGVLVFIVAIVPGISDRTIHILRAEMPGPTMGKLVPKLKDTAKILYLIYIGLTVAEFLFLLAGGMPVFDSIVHAVGTAGTGGLGIKADSVGSYSPYIQWVIAVFMLLFGVNFNLYYLILIKRVRTAFQSRELWLYGCIVLIGTAVITLNIYRVAENCAVFSDAIRHGFFQTASILTTTGFSTVDFNLWPDLSKSILFILMFLGGCAGSTSGGLKLSRAMILSRLILRERKKMIHPRSVSTVRVEGKSVDEETLASVSVYFTLYCVCIVVVFLLISFEPFGLETNFTAAVSCFNNIGPGLGKIIGPAGSYADYTGFSKIVLSFAMLFGRLEIYPLLLAFSPSTWSKR